MPLSFLGRLLVGQFLLAARGRDNSRSSSADCSPILRRRVWRCQLGGGVIHR
ncbi:hypothetical protein CGCF415_v015740 [Colletotrichum fructicola]|nr:hypothetical protein CGCF415_v015740 [Colletotrichum fructicola]KAF4920649.1 hypothetical protein CGCF245_v015699 [Colletotrichum fructicola]